MSIQKAHREFREAEETPYHSQSQRKEKYLNAARNYFTVAKNVDDKATRASLLYLSALSAQKAELFSTSLVPNLTNTSVANQPISSSGGRLNTLLPPSNTSVSQARGDAERGVRSKGSAREVVGDLLVLEARLVELGLMKSGATSRQPEGRSVSSLAAILSESFAAPRRQAIDAKPSDSSKAVVNSSSSSSRSGKATGGESQSASPAPAAASGGVRTQWPFGALPWGRSASETPATAAPPFSTQAASAQQLSVGCPPSFDPGNTSLTEDEYGKSSLHDLDTMKSGPSDASRNATVSAAIKDSIRQLLSDASTPGVTPTSSPSRAALHYKKDGTEQHSASTTRKDVFMSEGVLRLLKSVETLSDENAALMKRLRDLSTVEEQNFSLRKEIDNFKLEYSQKFARLKQSLREFADKHPIDENPAHAFLGSRQHASATSTAANTSAASASGASEEASAVRQAQLERTVKGLLSRLEAANQHLAQARSEADKKGRLVIKYENYYRELKRSVEKREQERLLAGGGSGANTTAAASDSASDNINVTSSITNEHIQESSVSTRSASQGAPLSPLFSAQSSLPPHPPPLPSRHKNPTTSTLEASLQRSAALEKKERKK